jgi:asparagine synthase (glutamine-hydrolysing)
MCGIGFLLRKNGEPVGPEEIDRVQGAIAHRGPDSRTSLIRENLGLGFTRLSIVDMQYGEQPLWNERRTVAVVCNGEIYNYKSLREDLLGKGHRLNSSSDCEVLPHLYEEDPEDFVSRLDGMFAFLLLDFEQRQILLCRDRVGIKPLVTYEDNRVFAVASEAKGLFATGAVPRALNVQGLYDFFCFGYIPGEQTAFAGVKNFPPATMERRTFQGDMSRRREYWSPRYPERQNRITMPGGFTGRLKETFAEAVRSHTIGDLPVGTYLSGGIDSTIVSILLKRYVGDRLRTFSIKFSDPEFDESPVFSRTVAQEQFNGSTHEVSGIALGEFRHSVLHDEQPRLSPADVPLCSLAGAVRDAGTKVVLCGEGSDELMGGYYCYSLNQANRALSLPRVAAYKPFLLDRILKYYLRDPQEIAHYMAVYSQESTTVTREFGTYPAWFPYWSQNARLRKGLFAGTWSDSLGEGSEMVRLSEPLKGAYAGIDEYNKSLYLELKTRLPNYVLHCADRNSMSHGVEARVPFLSHSMIDLLNEIPPILKMVGLKEKYILRKAFSSLLPKHVLKRTKFGYNAPRYFLWEKPEAETLHLVSERRIKDAGIFDPVRVAQLLKQSAESPGRADRDNAQTLLTGVLACQILEDERNR